MAKRIWTGSLSQVQNPRYLDERCRPDGMTAADRSAPVREHGTGVHVQPRHPSAHEKTVPFNNKGKHMDALIAVFGSGKDLDSLQMGARAVAVFIGALVCIRISGRRSFGQRSPFDYVVAILLGATLSRVIVGASPAVPTVVASLAIVVLHRVLAWGCLHSATLERLVGGTERELYRDGRFDEKQMSAALITQTDVFETARQQLGADDLSGVRVATLERNGEISLIRNKTGH
jgi:hypothetical protein